MSYEIFEKLKKEIFARGIFSVFLLILLLPLAKASVVLNATDFIGFNISASEIARIVSGGLIVSGGWVNATNANFSQICLSGNCKTFWPSSNLVGGSGSIGYIPVWTASDTLGNSLINQTGGNVWITSGNLIVVSGSVGIGTTSPGERLEVLSGGNIKLNIFPADDTTQGLVSIRFDSRDTGGSTHTWRMYTAPIAGGWGVAPNSIEFWEYPPGGGSLRRFVILKNTTASPSVVAIDGAGNVGIGTTSPSYKLTVSGGDIYGSNNLYIAGNVGIGTTNPVKKLDVVGDINSTNAVYSTNGYYVGNTQVIDSSRNVIAGSWVNGTNAYFTGTIYGNIRGSISPTGDINMNGYSIYNANWVNATNLNASNTVYATIIRGATIYQGANQVIDTITANAPISISGSSNSRTIGLNYDTGSFTLSGSNLALSNTGVTAGTYGSASQVAQFTVNAQGRITSASNISIAIDASQITSGIISGARLDSNVAWLNRSQTWTASQTFNENVWFNKNVFIAGNLSYVNVNTLNVNGSLIPIFNNMFDIGNSSNRWRDANFAGSVNTNNLVVSGYVNSNLIPGSDNSYDLGSSSNKWRNIFVYNINGGSPITGSGSTNYVAKFTGSNTLGNSIIYDNGTNVGIGTTSPAYKLDVAGTIRAQDVFSAGGQNLIIGDDTFLTDIDVANTLGIYGLQDSTQAHIKLGSNGPTISGVNGNVGIGITSPTATLHISSTNPAGAINIVNTTTGASLLFVNATTGNVGIGTTNPQYKLDVNGDIRAQNAWLRTTGNTGWYSDSYGGGWYMSDSTWIRTYNSKSVWTDTGLLGSNGGLTIGYGGASPPSGGAIIAGSVGIGTNNPQDKLDVYGTIRASYNSSFYSQILTDSSGRMSVYPGPADNMILFGQPNTDPVKITFTRYDGTNWHESYIGYLDTSNQLQLDSNGGQVQIPNDGLYVSGNVGIGTTTPSGKLSVYMSSDWGSVHIGGSNPDLWFDGGSDSVFWISNRGASSGRTSITYGNTELFTVLNNGNVGIGTTSPTDKLDVRGVSDLRGIKLYYDTWENAGQGDGGAKIVNDNANYKALMIVGSDQAQGKGRWIRMWDWVTIEGTGEATSSFRAPIYYDRDNTGYYVDPASKSVMNYITFGGSDVSTINFANNGQGLNWGNSYSRIYDDGHLRINTDDNMYINAPSYLQLNSPTVDITGNIQINGGAATGTNVIKGLRFFYAGDETQVSTTSTSPELKKYFTAVFDDTYGIKPRYINIIAKIWNSGGYTTSLNVTLEGCAGTVLSTASTSPTLIKGWIDVSSCGNNYYPTKIYLSTSDARGTAYNDLIEFYYVE